MEIDVLTFDYHFQLDPREFEKLQKTRDNNLREFEKRKRLCLNIIGEIMEGYPGTKQKLIKDTEIETDEAAGFDVNQYKWTVLNHRLAVPGRGATCGGEKQNRSD